MRENADNIRQITEKLRTFAANADEMILAHADLVRVSIEVTNSMVTMKNDTSTIENSIGVLLTTAERNKLAIDEISVGMREIAADINELNRVSAMNTENVRSLGDLTARFRIPD
jgi:hypothetical protein